MSAIKKVPAGNSTRHQRPNPVGGCPPAAVGGKWKLIILTKAIQLPVLIADDNASACNRDVAKRVESTRRINDTTASDHEVIRPRLRTGGRGAYSDGGGSREKSAAAQHGGTSERYFLKMAFGSIAWTPFVPSTTCVTDRSIAALASRYASSRERCFIATSQSSISRVAILAASSRSA